MAKIAWIVILLVWSGMGELAAQEKDSRTFRSGSNDGYSLSEVVFSVSKITGEKEVCKGGNVRFGVEVVGTGGYHYRWVKNGVTLGRDTAVLAMTAVTGSEVGRYYCEVTDLQSGYKRYSDTVQLQIHTLPNMTLDASLTDIAQGTAVTLTATGATHYQWSIGEATSQIVVTPGTTTVYRVTGYNVAICPKELSVEVKVRKLDVSAGPDRYVSPGETAVLKAEATVETVKWYRLQAADTKARSVAPAEESWEFLREGKELSVTPERTTTYKAEVQYTGMTSSTRLTVYVKGKEAYYSGKNDGFSQLESYTVNKLTGVKEICKGEGARFQVQVGGTDFYSYKWMKNGAPVGTDTSLLVLEKCTAGDAARYYCEVTDVRSGYRQNTDTVALQVFDYPNLSMTASLTKIAEGTAVTLSATGAAHYQWSNGESTAAIEVTPKTTTTYRVTGYDVELCRRELVETIEVLKLELSVGPDRYISPGETVELTAVTPLEGVKWYRLDGMDRKWLKDGKELTQSPDSTTTYEAEVQYTGMTAKAQLTVYVKGKLAYYSGRNDGFSQSEVEFNVSKITHPTVVCVGDEVPFSVSVTGTSAYTYRWKKLNGGEIGTDTASILLPAVQLSDEGSYYCEVEDIMSGLKRYSDTIDFRVKGYPVAKIGSPAGDEMICYGKEITLDARDTEFSNVLGDDYTYLWSGDYVIGDRDGAVIRVAPAVNSRYVVSVNNGGCIGKDTINIEVYRPQIDLPSTQIVSEGEILELYAQTEPAADLSWYVNSYDNLIQNDKATEAFTYGPLHDPLTVYVRMDYRGCPAEDSCQVMLKAGYAFFSGRNDGFSQSCIKPSIVESTPAKIAGCTADSLVIGLWAEGSGLEYRWMKMVNYDFVDLKPLAGANISGLGSGTLKFKPPMPNDEGLYRCVVRNECGEVVSDTFTVSVGGAPVLKSRLNRQWDQCMDGKPADMAVYVTTINNMPLTYQWYKDKVLLKGTEYNGSGISIKLDNKSKEGWYKVVVSNDCGRVADSTFLPVYIPAFINKLDATTYACTGGEAVFTVGIGGGGDYTAKLYEVKIDAMAPKGFILKMPEIGGGLKVSLPEVDGTYHGKQYAWVVSNHCGGDTSSLVRLVVEQQPEVTFVSPDADLCVRSELDLRCGAMMGESALVYRWYKNGLFTGVTGDRFWKSSVAMADSGNYVCFVNNKSCGVPRESRVVHVKVRQMAAISPRGIYVESDVLNSKGDYCQGVGLKLKVDILPPYDVDSVRWYRDKVRLADIPRRLAGSATTTLSIDSATLAESGSYSIRIYNRCEPFLAAPVSIRVLQPASFVKGGNQLVDMVLCQGTDQALSVKTTGTKPIRYTWTHNDRIVADGYSDVIQLKGVTADTAGVYCCEIHNGCAMPEVACANIKVSRPVLFTLEGGGSYCVNSTAGAPLVLQGSDTAVFYRLYRNGSVVKTIHGRDVRPLRGAITFENNPAGVYHVTGQGADGCEYRMPGTIEIKENTAPLLYPLIIARDFCRGTNGAILKLTGSENNPELRYTLMQEKAGSWELAAAPLAGTGGELKWEQIKAGRYKVMAENRLTGCRNEMTGVVQVTERNQPQAYALLAQGGDTVYCANVNSNVQLYLAGSEANVDYSLVKNRNEIVVTGRQTVWNGVPEGVYTVKAQNQWGCEAEMGYRMVVTQQVPVVTLSGETVFCEGDTVKRKIDIGGLDRKVGYVIYRRSPVEEYGRFDGVGGAVTIEVPAEEKEYYVVATDHTPEACSSTSAVVAVRQSSFSISAPAEVKVLNGNTANLTVQVIGGVTPKSVEWQPANLINGDAAAQTVTTVGMTKGASFTVTVVTSGGCVLQRVVKVTVIGSELVAEIRRDDQLTAVDTVHLCANEKIGLYGWNDGGTGEYTSRWYDGISSSSGQWLRNYSRPASGYLYYEVMSGVISRKDSVYVDVLDTARIQEIRPAGLYCTVAEAASVELDASEPAVFYTLEYDRTGSKVFAAVGSGIYGNGGVSVFPVNGVQEATGYYRIKAERSYLEGVCRSYSRVTEIRSGAKEFAVTGSLSYCSADRLADTVTLADSEEGVTYRLVRRPAQELAVRSGNDGALIFAGAWGAGTYRVKATRGRCEAWMADSAVIGVKESPADRTVAGAGSYCETDVLPVIGVRNAEEGVVYTLYRDRLGVVNQEAQLRGPGNLTFGSYRNVGEYYVVAQKENNCERTLSGRVWIGNMPADFRVAGGGAYPFGTAAPVTTVKAWKARPGVQYNLNRTGGSRIAGMGGLNNDTVYYRGALPGGAYVVKATAGGCSFQSADTVFIKEIVIKYNIIGETLYCDAGGNSGVPIGIDGTQPGVRYLLQVLNTATGNYADVVPQAALTGSGMADRFGGLFKAGDYRIVADLNGRQPMNGVLQVRKRPVPDVATPVEIEGNVCVDSTVRITLTTEAAVKYTLYHQGELTAYPPLTGDGTRQTWEVAPAKAGVYRIKADNGECDLILPQEIETGTLPSVGVLDGDARLCANVKGSLWLDSYSDRVTYTLYKAPDVKIGTGKVVAGRYTYADVLPATYYVRASVGMCVKQSNAYTIEAVPAAELPAGFEMTHSECAEAGQGWIRLKGLAAGQKYVITGSSLDQDMELASGASALLLDELPWGEYCLTATDADKSCRSTAVCVTIRENAPKDTLAGDFVYCEEEYGARLRLSGTTTGGVYTIYNEEGLLLETLTSGTAFRKNYEAGKYIFEKKSEGLFESCVAQKPFTIKQLMKPDSRIRPEVAGVPAMCAGGSYLVGLQSTEAGVRYMLRRWEGSVATEIDTLVGDGLPGRFIRPVGETGYYRIYAQWVGGSCGVYLDSVLQIHPLPAEIRLTGCALCGAAAEGCVITAGGMESDVRYILYDRGNIPLDTLTGPGTKGFAGQQAGEYYVVAEELYSGCRRTLATPLVLKRVPLPQQLSLRSACATSAEVVTLENSEGDTVTYKLYRYDVVVKTLQGTGAPLNFGGQTTPGVYKVWAQNPSGCGVWLKDSVTVYNQLGNCGLRQKGEYCGSGSTGISLHHDCSKPGWNYYLTRLGMRSDTLAGNMGERSWRKIGGRELLLGTYQLHAFNGCKDTLLAEHQVMTAPSPLEQVIAGSGVFCGNDGFDIILAASESGVDYRLVFRLDNGSEAPLAKAVGVAGGALKIGSRYASAGRYRVYGKFAGSACEVLVAEKVFTAGIRPKQRNLRGQDVCLTGTNGGIGLSISLRDEKVSYYLYRTDTKAVVDSLTALRPGVNFETQTATTCYAAYAVHETSGCRLDIEETYCLSLPPSLYQVENPGDTVRLCSGEQFCVAINGSDISTKYLLLQNGSAVGKEVVGTGGRLEIGCVGQTGTYRVKGFNGCELLMGDSVTVKENLLPVLVKETPSYRYCENSDSVAITILQPTRSDVDYTLYQPSGGVVQSQPGTGRNLTFAPKQTLAGYYRIRAEDRATHCVRTDSVKVVIDTLPHPYILAAEPNEYICVGSSVAIRLSGSEKNVHYTLYHGDSKRLEKDGTGGKLLFEKLSLPGNYTVHAVYNNAQACERDMFNIVTLRQADTIRRFELEGTKKTYCHDDAAMGTVTLKSSESRIKYELYRDGQPTGLTQQGTGGALVWTHLEGKACGQYADGTDNNMDGAAYHVVGLDEVSGCVQAMNGTVKILQEAEVKLKYFHPNKDLYVCQDSAADFTVVANGCNLSYRWWHKTAGGVVTELQSGTEPYYNIAKVKDSHYGTYWCEIGNSCHRPLQTPGIEMKVRRAMEVKTDRNVSVCDRNVTTIRLEAIYYGKNYRWYKAGDEERTLGNSQVLELKNITAASSGSYVCVADNDCYTLTDTCVLRAGQKPAWEIVKAVTDTLCRGNEYELLLSSTDSVAWYRNGVFTGTAGNRFYLPQVKPSDEGHYSVKVIGGCDEVMADVADLYVDDTIRIIDMTHDNFVLCEGRSVELFIETAPSERVAYAWSYAGENIGNSNHITYGPLAATNTAYTFRVTFKNECLLLDQDDPMKPANYRDIRIRVNEKVDIKDPPREIVVCAGTLADTVLRVGHNDLVGLSYTWHYYKSEADTLPLPSTADTLRVALQTANSGYYFCRVNNGCEVVPTNSCFVRIDSFPVAGGDFAETDTLCEGGELALSLPATGGSLRYQWVMRYKDGQTDTVGRNLVIGYEGAGDLLLSPLTMRHDSALVWCDLQNDCGGALSDTMLLHIRPFRELSVDPDTLWVCGEQKGKVLVHLTTGTVPWKYSYMVNGGNEQTRTLQYTTDTLIVRGGGLYAVTRLEDRTGCVRTDGLPEFSVIPSVVPEAVLSGGGAYCAGDAVSLHIGLSGGAGPWEVWLADEYSTSSPFNNPLTIYSPDTTLQLMVLDSALYYIDKVTLTGGTCLGRASGTARVKVNTPDIIDFALSGDNRVGACRALDLCTKLNPTLRSAGTKVDGKIFYINDIEQPFGCKVSADTWLSGLRGEMRVHCEYTDANGCLVSSDEVSLYVDTLPFATITMAEHACGNVQTEYAVELSGTPKFTLELEQRLFSYSRYRQDEQFRRWTPELGVKDTVYKGVRSWTETDSCMILRVVAVTDRHGCRVTSPETALPSDTVYHHLNPDLEIRTRYPNVEKSGWTKGMSPVYIARGDSVGVKATLTQGDRPWNLICNPRGSIRGIHGTDTVFALDTGRYRITAVHEYCKVSASYGEELVVSYRDTGYLKIKVLLDGPFDAISGRMHRDPEVNLPLYGVTALPDLSKVPGGEIIDWIEVELRTGNQRDSIARLGGGTVVVAHDTCLLWSDGTVTDRLGDTVIALPGASVQGINNYYVLVRHRNHLGVMSARTFPVSRKRSDVKQVVDFTKANSIYTADGKQKLHMSEVGSAGYWALSAGDMNANALVSVFDPNKMNLDELSPDSPGISAPGGYNIFDVNFDGRIGWPGWGKEGTLDWDKVRGNRHQFMEVRF